MERKQVNRSSMTDKSTDGDFESFVRRSFDQLNTSVRSLAEQHGKQTEKLEQLTKTVNKHNQILSRIQVHEKEIGSINEAIDVQSNEIQYLKSSDEKLRRTLEDQVKRNRHLEKELKGEQRTVKNLENLCLELQAEVRQLSLEKEPTDPFEDVDKCLIVANLAVTVDEDVQERGQKLVDSLEMNDRATVTKAARLKPRVAGKPGVIKLAFKNKERRMDVLKAKGKLKEKAEYQQVWLHPCKSHNELVSENNMRTILKLVPEGQAFRISNSGRVTKVQPKKTAATEPDGETENERPQPIVKPNWKRVRVPSGENTDGDRRGHRPVHPDDGLGKIVEEDRDGDDAGEDVGSESDHDRERDME